MRLTEDEYQILLKQGKVREAGTPKVPASLSRLPQVETLPQKRPQTPALPHALLSGSEASQTRYRSKTEARFAEQLAWRVACGEVEHWWYEPCSLRLGVKLFYTPDFLVQYTDMALLQFVEVKGGWSRDDALVKLKAAATRFPVFTFLLAVWKGQRWHLLQIPAHP